MQLYLKYFRNIRRPNIPSELASDSAKHRGRSRSAGDGDLGTLHTSHTADVERSCVLVFTSFMTVY